MEILITILIFLLGCVIAWYLSLRKTNKELSRINERLKNLIKEYKMEDENVKR